MIRKIVLMTHVAASVGWMGAAAVFLAMGVVGMANEDQTVVRGVYQVMEPAAWLALLPFALASLVSGIVMSLVTTWGLFQHYWVVFKLLINAFATVVLLTYMATFNQMAAAAGDATLRLDAVRSPSPVLHSILALLLLIVAMALGVYKPPAVTRGSVTPGWVKVFGAIGIVVVVLYVALHLAGGGHARHVASNL